MVWYDAQFSKLKKFHLELSSSINIRHFAFHSMMATYPPCHADGVHTIFSPFSSNVRCSRLVISEGNDFHRWKSSTSGFPILFCSTVDIPSLNSLSSSIYLDTPWHLSLISPLINLHREYNLKLEKLALGGTDTHHWWSVVSTSAYFWVGPSENFCSLLSKPSLVLPRSMAYFVFPVTVISLIHWHVEMAVKTTVIFVIK